MGQFLQEITDDIRFTAEKKNMLVEYQIGSSGGSVTANGNQAGQKVIKPLYFVHVDPDRMREVIINLFDNAVKYSDQGKITIGLTGDDKVVQFRISDQGQGIPAEDVGHLFQKFYRVDNTATRTIGGTGLGLFICRKIVELYDGRIWVESQVGKGSTFFINLPRLSTSQANALLAQSSGPTQLGSTSL
jgi:signal transduction histidine kinase